MFDPARCETVGPVTCAVGEAPVCRDENEKQQCSNNAADRHRAVFLDRDGVLIRDVHLLTEPDQACLTQEAPGAVRALKTAGYCVIVVSNQTVVARGMTTEIGVARVHRRIQRLLIEAGGEKIDAFYFCPHHPNATLPQYRQTCDCRKPRPGMLLRAAQEWGINLPRSYMVGDRITDIIAGQRAGCSTIMIESGMNLASPIESPDPIDLDTRPDLVCSDLKRAVAYILGGNA